MPDQGGVNGPALAAVLAGTILLYSGIKGQSILKAVQAVIQGKSPATVPQTLPITPLSVGETGTGAAGSPAVGIAAAGTATALAADAQQYVGHPYSFGGYWTNPRGWDCSSFMNWVIGHDAGLAIPGYAAGKYDGTSHGPPTAAWLLWGGVQGITQAQLQPGDLCVWQTHMGMYVGNGQMVSALNPSLGTRVTTIAGGSPFGELLFCKRIIALIPAAPPPVKPGA